MFVVGYSQPPLPLQSSAISTSGRPILFIIMNDEDINHRLRRAQASTILPPPVTFIVLTGHP
jgi:hypothetical protein